MFFLLVSCLFPVLSAHLTYSITFNLIISLQPFLLDGEVSLISFCNKLNCFKEY